MSTLLAPKIIVLLLENHRSSVAHSVKYYIPPVLISVATLEVVSSILYNTLEYPPHVFRPRPIVFPDANTDCAPGHGTWVQRSIIDANYHTNTVIYNVYSLSWISPDISYNLTRIRSATEMTGDMCLQKPCHLEHHVFVTRNFFLHMASFYMHVPYQSRSGRRAEFNITMF